MASNCRSVAFLLLAVFFFAAACGTGSDGTAPSRSAASTSASQTFAVVVAVQTPPPQVPTSVGLGEFDGDIISLPPEFLTGFTSAAVHQRVAEATASKTGQDLDRVRDGFSIRQRSADSLTVATSGRGDAELSRNAANELADLIRSDPLARRFSEVSRANVIVTVSAA
ncbi:hypothetical protein [uncultured Williamsia sp.]|uniref:hypothetical protein n=1 Tax=uncultured Williamsia sp. TaxID=259311 RepID=UPI00262D72D8|nr:hypothetical protein [uncultured Williamsia sp.]